MRELRIARECIETFDLNLKGLTIFTEAASGFFAWTPIIALLAGADKVFAIAKDSRYGAKEEIKASLQLLINSLKIKGELEIVYDYKDLPRCDIITNLGFVRPISSELIKMMKKGAVIPLMWETWEFRKEELDLKTCIDNDILVLGTNEHHPDLQTFRYVGLLAKKLIFELGVEIFKSKIIVVGGGDFAENIAESLEIDGAEIKLACEKIYLTSKLNKYWFFEELNDSEAISFIENADAIVFADHQSGKLWLGEKGSITMEKLTEINPDIKIAHISGFVDAEAIYNSGLSYQPYMIAEKPKYMSASTDYLGPRPMFELHTAGLKAGEIMSKAMRNAKSLTEAKAKVLENMICMDFSEEQLSSIFGFGE